MASLTPKGPKCTVCSHTERHRIEMSRLAGASLDDVAAEFGLKRDAIWRHMGKHVTDVQKAAYITDVPIDQLLKRAAAEGKGLLDFLTATRSILMTQLQYASAVNSARGVAALSGRMVEILREMGRLTGEILRSGPATQITNNTAVFVQSPAFNNLQTMLLNRLAPYPEARAAVIEGLLDLERQAVPAPPMISLPMHEVEHV